MKLTVTLTIETDAGDPRAKPDRADKAEAPLATLAHAINLSAVAQRTRARADEALAAAEALLGGMR